MRANKARLTANPCLCFVPSRRAPFEDARATGDRVTGASAVRIGASLLVVVVLVASVESGCTRRHRLYPGEPRPENQIAVLEWDEHVLVSDVDGVAVRLGGSAMGLTEHLLEVEPGVHTLTVELRRSEGGHARERDEVRLPAAAGKTYRVVPIVSRSGEWKATVVEVPR